MSIRNDDDEDYEGRRPSDQCFFVARIVANAEPREYSGLCLHFRVNVA